MKLKETLKAPWKKNCDKPRQHIKKQRHHFADKSPYSQIYGYSSSHVWMWELNNKKGWVSKNWCFWTVVLEKTLDNPLDYKEIQPVYCKGDQFWVFFGRNDAKAETPVLWPPHVKSWLIGKDSDAGRDWGQEEKGMTENEMAGWHHRLDGCEFEWSPGVGDGQGGLACCDSWGHKESDMTEWLKWTDACMTWELMHSAATCYKYTALLLLFLKIHSYTAPLLPLLWAYSTLINEYLLSCVLDIRPAERRS